MRINTVSYDPAVIEVETDEGVEIDIYDGEKLITSGKPGEYTIPQA